MSIKVMTWLWDNSEQSSAELLTLLALADWCNDEGFCWPGLRKIKDRARYKSMGGAYACLERLLDAKEIAIEYRGRTSHKYYLLPYRESIGLSLPENESIVTTSKQWKEKRKPKQRSTGVEHTGSSTGVEHPRSTGVEHQSSTGVETNRHLTVSEPSFSPNGGEQSVTIYEHYERLTGAMLSKTIVDAIKDAVSEHGEEAVRDAMDYVAASGKLSIKALFRALDSGSDSQQVAPAVAAYHEALVAGRPNESKFMVTDDSHYMKVAWELQRHEAITPGDVPALWQHIKALATDWSNYSVATVGRYLEDYVAKRDGKKTSNGGGYYTPVVFEEDGDGDMLTPEEIAAIRREAIGD